MIGCRGPEAVKLNSQRGKSEEDPGSLSRIPQEDAEDGKAGKNSAREVNRYIERHLIGCQGIRQEPAGHKGQDAQGDQTDSLSRVEAMFVPQKMEDVE